jgi:MFS family permease
VSEEGSRIGQRTPGGRVLLILLLAYIFNFIDRQIIGILAVPIKAELALTDTQLSLMGGIAFALFYSGLAIPIAWLADRRSRVNIIAVSIALWSLFTAACGLAQNFWHLFSRAWESGSARPAGSPRPMRSFPTSIRRRSGRGRLPSSRSAFRWAPRSASSSAAGSPAISTGAQAFMIVGLAGLPAALLVRLGHPGADPRRLRHGRKRRGRSGGRGAALPDRGRDARRQARASGCSRSAPLPARSSGYGLIFWLPSFFSRSFGLELIEVSWFYGSIVLVGGVAGTWLGGWIGDRTGPDRPAAYALIPASCFLVAAPVFAAGLFAPSLVLGWILFRDRPDAGARLARTGDRRGPAYRAAEHAGDGLGQLPVHQQSDRDRLRDLLPRLHVGRDGAGAWRGLTALLDPLRARFLPAQRSALFRGEPATVQGLVPLVPLTVSAQQL